MFKNKKFEVKVVDDKPQLDILKPKPRFTEQDIALLKTAAKTIGVVWLAAAVIDAAARVAVANQENREN